MVLLMGASVVFMPLALPFMAPNLNTAPWEIAKQLLFLMAAPLAVGFAIALSGAAWVEGLLAVTRKITNVALLLVSVLMVGSNFKTLVSTLGSLAIGTYMLYGLTLIGVAYLVGGFDKPTRGIFALGAGCRNIPAALVVTDASSSDPAVTVMLIVAFVVSLLVLLGLATAMRPSATVAS